MEHKRGLYNKLIYASNVINCKQLLRLAELFNVKVLGEITKLKNLSIKMEKLQALNKIESIKKYVNEVYRGLSVIRESEKNILTSVIEEINQYYYGLEGLGG